MGAFSRDVRHAFRALARTPGTTVVIVLSLALGVGANAALYGAIRSLLFDAPPGARDAGRLVSIDTAQFNGGARGPSSYDDFLSIHGEREALGLSDVAAFDDLRTANAALGSAVQRVRIVAGSESLLTLLGLTPAAGSLGLSSAAVGPPPAVLSFALWESYGAPPDAIGKTIRIAGREHVVTGIAPRGFAGLHAGRVWDLWVPIDPDASRGRGDRALAIVARLAPAGSLDHARSGLERLARQLAARFPATNRGTRSSDEEPRLFTTEPYARMGGAERGQVTSIGVVVLGATGLLLLSACVNAASLLVSRGAARRRELAVKLALGASRVLLARQVLVESLLLSLAGGSLGVLFARWCATALPSFFAPEEAAMLDTRLSIPAMAVTMAIAAVAGVVFAIAPARLAKGTLDIEALRGDAAGVSDRAPGSTFRVVVVTAQIALSTIMLIAGGLLIRALATALEGDLGPGGHGVAITLVRMPGDLEGDVVRGIQFHGRALEQVRRIPGAEAAGWVATLPASRSGGQPFEIAVAPGVTETVDVDVNVASGSYFQTMRLPIIDGRTFDERDGALAKPVVVVNDVLAARYFGNHAAGAMLKDDSGTSYEVVGVVRSGRFRTFQEAPGPAVYFPVTQRAAGHLHLVVRTGRAAEPVIPLVEQQLRGIDGAVILVRSMTFEAHLAQALTLDRLVTTVVTGCGLAALLLATLGVYGVIADSVRRRTPEIGLRIALGANPRHVAAMVAGEGLRLGIGGAAAGAMASVALARIGATFVHAMPSVDALSLAIAPAVLMLIVALAAAVPVRRAVRISPTVALRAE